MHVPFARFLLAAERDMHSMATEVSTDRFRGITELTVTAPDHPRLLAIITGACAAAGANIVDAQIFTTTDGMALTPLVERNGSWRRTDASITLRGARVLPAKAG